MPASLVGMSESHVFVRPATGLDASAMGDIHARTMKAELVAATGARLAADVEALIDARVFANAWLGTISNPPSSDHHVLVAVHDGVIAGFVAFCPTVVSDDVVVTPARANVAEQRSSEAAKRVVVEVTALEVPAARQRAGHGSRLLAGATDTARQQGATEIQTWVLAGDDAHIKFFQAAGFAPAGLRRAVDVGGVLVNEHCWHALLAE